MREIIERLKKNSNSGSTLVTAVVIIAFMSILGTIALYLAGENFKMKVVDNSNKVSFYEAEEVVDLFKSALILDTANAAQSAGKAAGSQYIQVDSVSMREDLYLKNFKTELTNQWESHWKKGDGTIDAKKAVEYYFKDAVFESYDAGTGVIKFNITINGEKLECVINEFSTDISTAQFKLKDAFESPTSLLVPSAKDSTKTVPGIYKVKNLHITVTNSKNYTAVINTSFQISPPTMNFDSSEAMYKEGSTTAIDEVKYTDCVMYLNWTKE